MPRAGFHHFPPVHTPLSLDALARALPALAGQSHDALDRLTANLASFYRADRVALYGSGTQALSAAITTALDAHGGNRVVALPGYNCYDVATAAVAADARIIIYDIDPDTLSPDWDSFDAALGAGATTVVVASLYGYPIDWHHVERIANEHGVVAIEDAAQGIGGGWLGTPLGSLGRLSVLSFGRGKGWTGGGGGALLFRDNDYAPARAREATYAGGARAAVRAGAQWMLSNPLLYAIPASMPWLHLGETRYKPPQPLHAMTPFEAALLLETSSAARREAEERAAFAHALMNQFAECTHAIRISVSDESAPGWLRFPLRITSATLRERILAEFHRTGIAAGYPGTIANLDVIKSRLLEPQPAYTGSDALVREIVTLPTYGNANREHLFRLASILR